MRKERFETLSGIKLETVYGPDDLPEFSKLSKKMQEALLKANQELRGNPGEYPYERGVYKEGYRLQLPTLRQFSGQGLAPETNKRLHYLIGIGETGLSIAYDEPTLYSRDSDNDDWSRGYVGIDGVAIDTLSDFEDLFKGISLAKHSVSQTINFPSIVFFAMFLALAKKQKVPFKKLRGTLQADVLKEAISQKEYRFPMKQGMRLMGDTMEYCVKHLGPSYYPISVSGYHMAEAGASPAQELAFTLKNGLTFLDYYVSRGLPVDEVAARMSFFFNCKGFWEDIGKFRAARHLWATELQKRYGIQVPLKFHAQNSGASFKRQEPRNNVMRGTLQCLATFMGGAQSIHINSWDEEVMLPSYEAVKEAVRTQQIVGEEMHIADVVDPLGGSYFIESLTGQLETRARGYFQTIDEMGGMLHAIERGYPQLEIKSTSLKEAKQFEEGLLTVVGVNKYRSDEEHFTGMTRLPALKLHQEQKKRITQVKKERDNGRVKAALKRLSQEARGKGNLVEPILEAVEAYATKEEIMIDTLEPVLGHWRGPGD